ncbi:hypothetical protein CCUS01_13340 [Colletotrichum cuscutae]|uniref:DUF7703 domain-containing protein n=1 Tax=Colletotrichum cuscutae TaxID=1209917 RepID=A0AAI9YBY2_9PEZI|nr:hypothetical protein CCUS01_13340 [Colletotrichum cuscutae]
MGQIFTKPRLRDLKQSLFSHLRSSFVKISISMSALIPEHVRDGCSTPAFEFILATVFHSIAMYNVVELDLLIWSTFVRRSGLYFWSFVIATNGIIFYSVGFVLLAYTLQSPDYYMIFLLVLGIILMVSGQSMVLYSRLHLARQEPLVLRSVLLMIIIFGTVTHTPTMVFQFGTTAKPLNLITWFKVLFVWRKVEMTMFCIEESIISGLYIHAAISFFRLKTSAHGNPVKDLATPLLVVNGFVIFLDLTLLATRIQHYTASNFQRRALHNRITLLDSIALLVGSLWARISCQQLPLFCPQPGAQLPIPAHLPTYLLTHL